MAASPTIKVIQHLRRAVLRQEATGVSDGHLLGCFLEHRDEAALEGLVHRHGPMVWGVCRRLLPNHHDAEDAFQATFLVLVRKAATIRPREMLANWLYGVAYHTARKARAVTARRGARERQVTSMPEPEAVPEDLWLDLQPVLDQELSRLPDKYRVPLVLCEFEGRAQKDVARQLGWPEGTLSGRLTRARRLLAERLSRRGVVLSTGALAAILSGNAASATVPHSVLAATVRAASLWAAGAPAGLVSLKAGLLAEGVVKSMLLTKFKATSALLVVLGAISCGTGRFTYQAFAAGPAVVPASDRQQEQVTRPLEERDGAVQPPRPHPAPADVNPSKATADSDRRQPRVAEAAWDKELASVPPHHPPDSPAFGADHLAALHEHLRQIHARFPHLAALHEHLGRTQSGQTRPKNLLAWHQPGSDDGKPPAEAHVAVGQKVPDFTVTDLDGRKVTLRELQKDRKRTKKGVIVLSFWCSFCGSCRRVEQRLDQLARKFEGEAAVLALDASAGETAARVREFAQKNGLSLPILLDPTGSTADLFGTKVTTTTVVIDGEGVLRYCGRFANGDHGYAEEALKAVLAGREVRVNTTPHDG
jgi:RNA polymerase sigma factor (sigma-70 family)